MTIYLKVYFLIILSVLTFVHMFVLFWNVMHKANNNEEEVTECNIPVLNAFDASIMPFHRQIKIKCRNPTTHLIKSDLEHLMLADEPYLKMNKLNCCYTPYLKSKSNLADRKFADECVNIKGKVKTKDEFVKVECLYEKYTVYLDYLDFVLPKGKFPPVTKHSQHLNVMVLLLDGVSRMAFQRHLPETGKYLKKLGAIEFTKFMRVGENSFSNVMALLAGYGKKQHHICWRQSIRSTFDQCPFIWNEYAENKYLTAFVEDAGHTDTFNIEKSGFQYQPVDYYWRPFNQLLGNIKNDPKNANTPFVKGCAGDVPVHERFFGYLRKFFKRMSKDKQKFFAFFHSNSVSHEDNALLISIDDDLRNFFAELNRSKILKNTVMFFLSDHGSRYGHIRQTQQGYFESSLPFMFAFLPEQFRNKYLSLFSIFRENSDRLTTVFDIHETLKDIVDLKFGNIVSDSYGISLFKKLPVTRTCSDCGIPSEFCACAKSYLVMADPVAEMQAAQSVVSHLNQLLSAYRKCAALTLNAVLDVRYVKYQSHTEKYLFQLKVMVSTTPGTGLFEAILQKVKDKYVVLGTISRLSTYGKESSCIKDTDLKLYCYCQKV